MFNWRCKLSHIFGCFKINQLFRFFQCFHLWFWCFWSFSHKIFQSSWFWVLNFVRTVWLNVWTNLLTEFHASFRIARTFCFSNRGHGLYLSSPTEMQKFSVSSEFWWVSCATKKRLIAWLSLLPVHSHSLNEMVGELFLTREMPEPPKESFFRGLFGGGSRPLDREELCKSKSFILNDLFFQGQSQARLITQQCYKVV